MPPIVSGGGGFSSYLRTDFPAGPPVSALVQHIASSANPVGVGIPGRDFKFTTANAVGAGNCLVLECTYPHANTASVSDTNGNTWPAAAITVDAGVGGYKSSCFVLPNANAGLTTITVNVGGTDIIPFQYDLTEYNNIATSSPVNGTAGAASVTGPSLAAGTFTPTTNNDANGGNVILAYFAPAGGINHNPSSWNAGGSFTLLNADIAWNTNQGFPHASEWQIQTSQAAINPGITATGDSGDAFNCVAIALKVASAGAGIPAGIHVNKIIHQTSNVPPASSTWTLQFPCTGNWRGFTANEPSPVINITGVVDSEGNTWTKINPSADEPQLWYRENTTANQNLTVTLTISGTPATTSLRFYDVQGAVSSSSIGATAGSPSTTVSGNTTINNWPSITPQSANSLIIARAGLGQGPGFSVTSPAGATFSLVTYTDEIDTDLMENADLEATYKNFSTATKNFNWTMAATTPNSSFALAVEIKAA